MDDAAHPEAEKLHDAGRKFGGGDLARKIAFGVPLPRGASDAEKAAWVLHITRELEGNFGEETIKAIRTGCHCRDRLEEMKAWLGGLYREASGIEGFVAKVNAHGAGWYIEDGAVYTKFLDCECYMLRAVDGLESKTWCYCTLGYTKALFGAVFGHEVEVELVHTIKMGHDFCLVKVTP